VTLLNRHEKSMQAILKKYPVKEQWRLSLMCYMQSFKHWDTWAAIGLMILWGQARLWLLPTLGFTGDSLKWIFRVGMLPFVVLFAWVLTRNADKHLRTMIH
jgi:hypothetical protein